MPYNKQEEEQIAYIHDQYDQCGLGKIPSLLEVEEVAFIELLPVTGVNKKIQGKYPAKKENFESTEMKKQLHQGPLRNHAENILIKICAYQKERHSRPLGLGSGTLDDPIHLLLEEVKDWTIRNLSAFGCHTDLQQQVNARMKYLKMLEKSDLFPAGKLGDLHIGSTLLEVIDELQEAKITIKATLESASAEMELKQLVFSTKNLLQHTTQYLYFIFRSDTSDDFTFDNMRRPHKNDKAMQGILNTKTGEFLRTLIYSRPFLKLFPDEKATVALNAAPMQELMAFPVAPTFEENPFLGKDLLPTQANQKSYGVHAIFLERPDTLVAFIELHALLLELGHFTLVCEDLRGLARWGGDILIYGLANQKVASFLQHYFGLMDSLFTRLSAIHQFARTTYKTQKQAESRDGWLKNYNKAESIYAEIGNDKIASDTWANHILTKSRQGISEYQRKRILEQIIQVLGEVDRFSERMDYLKSNTPLPPVHPPLTYHNKAIAIESERYKPIVHERKNKKTIPDRTLPIQTPSLLIEESPMEQKDIEQKGVQKKENQPQTRDASQQGVYQGVFHQEKNKSPQSDKKSPQQVGILRNTGQVNSVMNKISPDILDDSSSLEEDSSDEEIEVLLNPHRELIFRKDETPLYLQNVIASFNDPAYEVEITSLWQNYFEKQKKMGGKGRSSLPTIIEGEENRVASNFLDEFKNDLHLPTAGPLSTRVTKIVKAFEKNDLDHEKPKGFFAEMRDEDKLWEGLHHELFYLKYLCVKAAKSNKDEWSNKTAEGDLKEFIERLKDESPMGKGWNYFSDYKNLKNQLIEVYEQIKSYRLKPRKVPHHQVHQVKKNERLTEKLKKCKKEMQEQNDQHEETIAEFENLIRRKNVLISRKSDEIRRQNEAIRSQHDTIETQNSTIESQKNKIEIQKNTIEEQANLNVQHDTKSRRQSQLITILASTLLSQKDLPERQRKTIEELLKDQEEIETQEDNANNQNRCHI